MTRLNEVHMEFSKNPALFLFTILLFETIKAFFYLFRGNANSCHNTDSIPELFYKIPLLASDTTVPGAIIHHTPYPGVLIAHTKFHG